MIVFGNRLGMLGFQLLDIEQQVWSSFDEVVFNYIQKRVTYAFRQVLGSNLLFVF